MLVDGEVAERVGRRGRRRQQRKEPDTDGEAGQESAGPHRRVSRSETGEGLGGGRGVEGREVRVDGQRPAEILAGRRGVAQRLVDHAAVEVEQGVGRTEPERLVGESQGLGLAAVGVQLPGQGVGGMDALPPPPFRLSGGQPLIEVDAVVG